MSSVICAPLKLSITRPKGRVRIETSCRSNSTCTLRASPGRKAGCGLKQPELVFVVVHQAHHPAERPGAD